MTAPTKGSQNIGEDGAPDGDAQQTEEPAPEETTQYANNDFTQQTHANALDDQVCQEAGNTADKNPGEN